MNTPLALLFQRMRTPLIVLIGAYGIAIGGFTLVPGFDEGGEPWTMNFLHALYVVSYTGSTIGFGEIPAEFSDAQRMWTIVCIYLTVFAWLYAIGSLVALARDDAFRAAISRRQLLRSVRRITEPFYLICGYGDSGQYLVNDLTRRGRRVVVVDRSSGAIRDLALRDHGSHVPGFHLDASVPGHLLQAGLQSRWCAGLLAITDSDETNLKIAIAGRLLNRTLNVIARADAATTASNLASFDTGFIVRPADEFARRVSLAITRPETYRLYERLTEAGAPEQWEPGAQLGGSWILCGFNAFGRALHEKLSDAGVDLRIIDEDAADRERPAGSIQGRSSEGETLDRAGVRQAVGLVAMHDSDAANLSTIITARAHNPNLLLIARENHVHNRQLFAEAGTHLASSINGMIASAIRPILEAPLVVDFVDHVLEQEEDWNRQCLEYFDRLVGENRLEFWSARISERRTPALASALESGRPVTVDTLTRDPRNREQRLAVAVLMVRGEGGDDFLPDQNRPLAVGDRLLFCGVPAVADLMWAIAVDDNVLHYLICGETRSAGWFWRWIGAGGAG